MRMLNVDYSATVNLESVRRGRTFYVADEIAKDLYGYEIEEGGEYTYLEKMQEAVNVLEELEGNEAGPIQSIG